jgi:hypothetical protein
MSKRINISIPDTLADRLESFKPRINVSQVCATALEREIGMLETVKVESQVLQEAVGRLRAQRRRLGDWSREEGFKDGTRWALEKAEYTELKWFAGLKEVDDWGGEMWREMGDFVADKLDELRFRGVDTSTYFQGFAEGVRDVWKRIEKDVESD